MHLGFFSSFRCLCINVYFAVYQSVYDAFSLFYLYIKDTQNRCNAQLFEAYFKVFSMDWLHFIFC